MSHVSMERQRRERLLRPITVETSVFFKKIIFYHDIKGSRSLRGNIHYIWQVDF